MVPPNNIAEWASYPKPPPPPEGEPKRPDLDLTSLGGDPPTSLGCGYVLVLPRE